MLERQGYYQPRGHRNRPDVSKSAQIWANGVCVCMGGGVNNSTFEKQSVELWHLEDHMYGASPDTG